MKHKRKFPKGTVGWVGSSMKEPQQEDIFLFCDDRLVAVNVGPDPAYASLVYDTNQNNGLDSERSARLHSAFRVIKEPLGQDNAIGFQLNTSGDGDTQGGYFVDFGDGGSTSTTTGGAIVPTGGGGHDVDTTTAGTPGQTTTTGSSGGAGQSSIIIGQGSYTNEGPLHVGSPDDKHNHGFDADGNPINGLHIWAKMNFYLNQVEDGPLRIETWQPGQDQDVIVPVHFGWTGIDWAWWTTSHFYNPDPYPPPSPPYSPTTPVPYPMVPWPWPTPTPVPTPGPSPSTTTPTPAPYTNFPIPTQGTPTGYGGIISGGNVAPGTFTGGGTTGGGTTGGALDPGTYAPGGLAPYPVGAGGGVAPVGSTGGAGAAPATTGTPGSAPTPLDGVRVNPLFPGGIDPYDPGDDRHLFPTISNDLAPSSVGPSTTISGPTIPNTILTQIPFLTQDTITGSSISGPPLNTIASTGAIVSQAMVFGAQNYAANQTDGGLFGNVSSSALRKTSTTSPLSGIASTFAAQGGTIASSPVPMPSPTPAPLPSPSPTPAPSPTPTPVPAPATTTGGLGDPWNYTSSPRGQTMAGKQMSRYRRGTASGGIVFHPPETDLRDVPAGLVPQNVNLSTMTVAVGPNAYFAAGVPELVNGSIKSGYRWGVDTTTGDLVFYSISFSQPPIEAVRFVNSGQVIRWRSTENVYGELSHANTTNRRYSFPDVTGWVVVTSSIASSGGGATATNGTVGGSGPVSATMAQWGKMRFADGNDYWVQGWQ